MLANGVSQTFYVFSNIDFSIKRVDLVKISRQKFFLQKRID